MFSPRNPRMNRGRVPGRVLGLLPTQIEPSNLLLWLRADQGVTLSSASVNALTAWSLSNITRTTGQTDPDGGANAIRITDTADGVPTVHSIIGTVTNAQSGPGLFRVWAKAGTLDQIQIQMGQAATSATFFTFSTGLFSGAANCTNRIVSTAAGGWFLLELSAGVAAYTPNAVIYTAVGGTASYTGAGTGTIFLYSPNWIQDRVSAWADQSSNGNNATQGTAGSQMLFQCYDSAGNWVPTGTGGACAIGWPQDANKLASLPAGIATAIAGINAPSTVLGLMSRNATSATSCAYFQLNGAASIRSLQLNSTYNLLSNNVADGGAPTKLFTSAGVTTANTYHSLAQSQDSTASAWFDGIADSANGTDVAETQTNTSAAMRFAFGVMGHELVIYKSVLSATNRKLVENGMRARWALAAL